MHNQQPKIKRPASVLDEDDYTDALSDIIARDYFPGLQESRAQQEYLAALDSNDATWIAEAAQRLRSATATAPHRRQTDAGASTATGTPIKNEQDTPVSGFQSRYTSEDNASFNDVLDKQNATRRNKHAYLWTADQRIPTKRLLLHRAKQQQLLTQRAHDEAAAKSDGRQLVPLTSRSADDSRPAQPDTWRSQSPANTLMFSPASVDQDGLTTLQEERERKSKAGPKAIVLENTRFPSLRHVDDDDQYRHSHASSPSLNTDIINARRNPASAATSTISPYPGGETPRVNGYAFVDEDEPVPEPAATAAAAAGAQPSYRDLLAGQAAVDETPNPFKLSSARRRELLHHKLVDEANRKKRAREMQPGRMPWSESAAATPGGNMTPAARKLLENLAKTPAGTAVKREHDKNGPDSSSSSNIWTPVRTPRRPKVK
ncbi:hypothetical protein DV737_g5536, partial [Chaetothyriales sp. CBS 132003]